MLPLVCAFSLSPRLSCNCPFPVLTHDHRRSERLQLLAIQPFAFPPYLLLLSVHVLSSPLLSSHPTTENTTLHAQLSLRLDTPAFQKACNKESQASSKTQNRSLTQEHMVVEQGEYYGTSLQSKGSTSLV